MQPIRRDRGQADEGGPHRHHPQRPAGRSRTIFAASIGWQAAATASSASLRPRKQRVRVARQPIGQQPDPFLEAVIGDRQATRRAPRDADELRAVSASVRKSTGKASTAKPALRNTPIARGMCQAEVTRSQRSPGLGSTRSRVKIAFSRVLRDLSSRMSAPAASPRPSNSSLRAIGLRLRHRRDQVGRAAGEDKFRLRVQPRQLDGLGHARGGRSSSRHRRARHRSAPPSTMMPATGPFAASCCGKRFSSGHITRRGSGLKAISCQARRAPTSAEPARRARKARERQKRCQQRRAGSPD